MSRSEPIKTLSVHLVKLDKFYYDVFKQNRSLWPIRGNTSKGKCIYLSNPLSEGGGFYYVPMIDIKMKSNYKNPKGLWDDI